MKRHRVMAVLVVMAVVAAGGLAAFGLPWWTSHQDQQWREAGQEALAKVAVGSPFAVSRSTDSDHRDCSTTPDLRCFVAPGDPAANVDALKAALEPLSTGTITSTCFAVPVQGSPDSCHVEVPVRGARLSAELFSRQVGGGASPSTRTWSGSMVLLHLADR